MNGDDICQPNRFLKQLICLWDNTDVVILGTNVMLIYENSKEIGKTNILVDHHNIVKRIEFSNPMIHLFIVMKYRSLDQLGGCN